MSCGAKSPVYVVFIGELFPGIVRERFMVRLVCTGNRACGVNGVLFYSKKTSLKANLPMFIMELPPYRMPLISEA